MGNNAPIGIFDSGIGGLTVWNEIRKSLPHETLIYFGDGKNCPYGGKTEDEIRGYSIDAVEYLLSQGVKMVIAACNTATAASITWLRDNYPDIPFVGMEPAVKPAAEQTRTGVIGVIATEASLRGELFLNTCAKYAGDKTIIKSPGTGFVEIVENDQEDSPGALEAVRKVLEPLIVANADHIVLGCTHYPFLGLVIQKVIAGMDIKVIDSAPAVAKRVANLLSEKNIQADKDNEPSYLFHTLGSDDYLAKLERKAAWVASMDY